MIPTGIDDIPQTVGVYALTCMPTGKLYVGSAVQLRKRVKQHFSELKRGVHKNRYLQAAHEIYGVDAFTVAVLEYCTADDVLVREQDFIDRLCGDDRSRSFNLSPTAASTKGLACAPETRLKIAATLRDRPGRKHHPWTIALKRAQLEANPEWKAALLAGAQKWAVEHREELRAQLAKAKTAPGIGAKISAGLMGRPMSAETRAKIGTANRGRKRTTEARAKMSASRTGKQASAGTKAKMAAARADWWARKRAETQTGEQRG